MEPSTFLRWVFVTLFLLLYWSNCLASVDDRPADVVQENDLGIPFCPPVVAEQQQANRLVFVSTMDGKVSALSLEENGAEKWSIETGPGPMLSSSIHNLEISNNGQRVRMIPSLSGGLYQMNGKSVEAVPITAENLLKSSFRYSDDMVISGGIETRTYGVDSNTGKILYECSMSSCDNYTTPEQRQSSTGDVLLIQRQTQTVRAIEPRDGTERWNFSVGQHDLKLSSDPKASCHNKSPPSANEVNLKVIVPDGLVCALDSTGTVLWKHKFEYPVVSAWSIGRSGDIKYIDLFGGTRTPEEKVYLPESPVLYIGMHNKQLYIQESVRLRNKVLESVDRMRQHLITGSQLPSIPWRPISAHTSIGTLGIEGSSEPILQITDETSSTELQRTIANSILYASDYVDGKGFYLYASAEQRQLTDGRNQVSKGRDDENDDEPSDSAHVAHNISEYPGNDDGTFIEDGELHRNDDDRDETPVQVIIVSFWYWWKEVMLTSIFTAIVVNLIIQRRFISVLYSGRMNEGNGSPVPDDATKTTNVTNTTATSGGSAVNLCPANTDFTSRYLTDFEPVRRLGRGGFGIVFQAKNKMDDCEYAIKRIPLPNKEEALERMKREVKALAKLDHQNIVRYFNSWVEEPPPGWQETADNLYFRGRDRDVGSEVNIDLSGAITPTSDAPSPSSPIGSTSIRKRNVLKSLWDKASSAIYRTESVDKDLVLPRTNDDASGSFIVFEHSKSNANSKTGGSTSKGHKRNKSDASVVGSEGEDEDRETDVTDVSRSTRDRRHRRPMSLDLGSSDNSIPAPRLRKFLYIQMQLCQRDSLKDWLVCNPAREKSKVLNIFEQIVSAVDYVHFQGLIHRDLKPSNIFFSYDGQIKVGDFGLVTTMSEDSEQRSPLFQNGVLGYVGHTAHVGTHLYMSPEQLAGRQYDYKVDIFSLGVILFELLTAFSTEMERAKTLAAVRRLEFPPNFEKEHPEEAALLRLMLCDDPNSRLTTIGVRDRPPLRRLSSAESDDSADWHYTLPHRTRLRPSSSE